MTMQAHILRAAGAVANQSVPVGQSITVKYGAGTARIYFDPGKAIGQWDWGDGSAPIANPSSDLSRELSSGTTAKFTGSISGGIIRIYGSATDVMDWIEGPSKYSLYGASSLVRVPDFLPTSVTDLEDCFRSNSSLNQPLPWDVSRVTDMRAMFQDAVSFNQDLSGWCVSLISSKPTSFDFNTPSWIKGGRQPIWGTCP